MKKRKPMLVVVSIVVLWLGIRWANSHLTKTTALGVTNNQLGSCPDRPNCVSTQTDDPYQRMDPISKDLNEETLQKIANVIRSMPRSRIVSEQEGYLRAEFRTFLLGFVDDVEFATDDVNRVINFRSASRIGYSDFGVNRDRMEQIREQILE